jgi:prolyl oligopeptidase
MEVPGAKLEGGKLMFRTRNLLGFALLVFINTLVLAQTQPVAPVRPVVDDYFGTEVTDPYRYMEDLDDPDVQAWMKAQADYTEHVLSSIPGRDEVFERMMELDASVPAKVGGLQRLVGGKIFYRKRLPDEEVSKLYMRNGLSGEEVLLIDPDKLEEDTGVPHALSYFTPSWDGRYVAYGISPGGSENASLYVLDTETGEEIGEPITRAQFGAIAWMPNGKSFMYNRLQETTPDMPPNARYLKSMVYLHKLGSDVADDLPLFGFGIVPYIDIEEIAFPFIATSPGSPYALAAVLKGVEDEVRVYAAPISDLGKPGIRWLEVCNTDDKVTDLAVSGDHVYLLTHKDAPRYKVIKTSISEPDLAASETVVPESEAVIQGMAMAKDALYVHVLDGGIGRYLRVPHDEPSEEGFIPLPFEGTLYQGASDPRLSGIVFGATSWNDYGGIYVYDPETGKTTGTGLQPKGPYDSPENLVSKQVHVKSHDGVMVPLSIVHMDDVELDGTNPTLLMGYGAYGISMDPFYDHTLLAWYERGGILAIAHVRGGGEYGVEWHKAGQKATKPNTWKDFIACAEYLIAEGYTSPRKLAGTGGSAGGILIGRAMTERPDLFAAAIPQVGDMNMLRAENQPSGPANVPEFGTSRIEEDFKALYEMDSYHHVVDGTAYPAVLLTHGMNDPRVAPWQSAKMAARLQAATQGGKPVLLRLEYESGHGIGSTKSQRIRERADGFAFAMWQFGVPVFQLE